MAHESRVRTIEQKKAEKRRVRKNRTIAAAGALAAGSVMGFALHAFSEYQTRNIVDAQADTTDTAALLRESVSERLKNGQEVDCMFGEITFSNPDNKYLPSFTAGESIDSITLHNPIVVPKLVDGGNEFDNYYFVAAQNFRTPYGTIEPLLVAFDGAKDRKSTNGVGPIIAESCQLSSTPLNTEVEGVKAGSFVVTKRNGEDQDPEQMATLVYEVHATYVAN